MRVPDDVLDEVRERGFSLMEGFLGADELAAAQGALQKHFPRPDEYFADPDAHPHFASSQFAGVEEFPYRSWDLNRLAVHPDLVDAAERYLETAELHLYKVELWAKYSGAVNYDQPLHRDYGSHSLVVPRPEARYQQLTTFIYLSDVTDEDGPTCIVPYEDGKDVPYTPLYLPFGTLADRRGAMHRPGGLASGVPDRHLAPGLGHDGRGAVASSRSSPTSRSAAPRGAARWPGPNSTPTAGRSSCRSAPSASATSSGFPGRAIPTGPNRRSRAWRRATRASTWRPIAPA